ncbi:hypothetical protein AALO_G00169910 [Alosa alosa]|uniref:Uncharacterized protein n=1 Tax=Alosa alosa TaxID=278164 RepID=A0AAV6GCK9_9TELE|nr:uncharacterized protein LOC125304971 [Alosa alosa]KAG5272843.1 hypothetical protein AALO_G00169910 [Alosa alosa]
MSPQLHLSTYSEEFSPSGRWRAAQPCRPRPSSAHRRNNPHPRPDFLFPWKPQTGRGPRPPQQVTAPLTLMTPVAPVAHGAPLFPPVRHMSTQCPEDMPAHIQARQKAADKEVLQKVALHTPKVCVLPPADWLSKVQSTVAPFREKQPTSSPQRKQGKFAGADAQRRGQVVMDPHIISSLQTVRPPAHYSRSNSKTSSDSSGGHSCFHVVKPFKASFYIIHPEFVSEYQR